MTTQEPARMDAPNQTSPIPDQQKLLDLAERVATILEMQAPPEQASQKLMADYGVDALALAEACAKSFPGKRNSNKQAYWQTIADFIRKAGTTTH